MKISLTGLHSGDIAQIVDIDTRHPARLHKLGALGLVPGSLIRLQQRYPAYIVWVGETQLSIDEAVAREIIVKRFIER